MKLLFSSLVCCVFIFSSCEKCYDCKITKDIDIFRPADGATAEEMDVEEIERCGRAERDSTEDEEGTTIENREIDGFLYRITTVSTVVCIEK